MPIASPLSRSEAIAGSPSLLDRLRQCTRERHEHLDAGIDFRRGTVTSERYAAFLQGSLAVVEPLEAALARWFPAADTRSRSECLRDDLRRLGFRSDVARARVRLPVHVAQAYGCAYVLEGSALGGLALAPIVAEALGVPASYLRFREADTGRAWRAWLDKLKAFGDGASEDDIRAACDMACATFDAYAESLRTAGAFAEHPACSR
jgi:heme oxygenase